MDVAISLFRGYRADSRLAFKVRAVAGDCLTDEDCAIDDLLVFDSGVEPLSGDMVFVRRSGCDHGFIKHLVYVDQVPHLTCLYGTWALENSHERWSVIGTRVARVRISGTWCWREKADRPPDQPKWKVDLLTLEGAPAVEWLLANGIDHVRNPDGEAAIDYGLTGGAPVPYRPLPSFRLMGRAA